MAKIDTQILKKFREETGVSISLCHKALYEADGDPKKAKKILERWGVEKAGAKDKRETKQGAFFPYIHHNGKVAGLLELLCETDFVAKNEEFKKLGHELAMQVSFSNPQNLNELLKMKYMRDQEKTIENLIAEYILKIGENIKIGRFIRYEL